MRQLFMLASLGLSAANAIASPNLVVNGSFEQDAAPTASFTTGIPTGWSGLGNGSTVDILAAGYSGGVAAAGQQYVDLIGASIGTFPSGLQQIITLQAGSYTLSFAYNGDADPSGESLDYSLAGLLSGSINVDSLNNFPALHPTVTPWQLHSEVFSVTTAGNYLLRFQTPNGAWGSPYLDQVVLTENTVAEPDSLVLFTLGFAVFSGLQKRL